MTLDETILLLNGVAYFGLFLGYQWTAATFHRRLPWAWLAGLTSLVFAILFFYRASGVEFGESSVIGWLFRIGVFTYCLGGALTLRALTRPEVTTKDLR